MIDPLPLIELRQRQRGQIKICITGGPRTGKTTLADQLAEAMKLRAWHTDDHKDQPWEDQALSAADYIEEGKARIIEGVSVARGLRALLRREERRWCDVLYVMQGFKVPATPAQVSLAKGCITVLQPVARTLLRCGTEVVFLP